jgi:hypothetical protein
MTDLSVFAEPGFDPKAWINTACAGKPQDEPLERFLAELEMRLQVCVIFCHTAQCACLCMQGSLNPRSVVASYRHQPSERLVTHDAHVLK